MSRTVVSSHHDDPIDVELEELRSMTTDELQQEIASCVQDAARKLRRVALCIRILEEDRGVKPRAIIDEAMMAYLRMISQGRLIPEAVVELGGKPQLLRKVAELPIDEQKKIVDTKKIKVVRINGNGAKTYNADVSTLSRSEIAQVFDGPRVRTPEQQRQIARKRIDPATTDECRYLSVPVSVAEFMKIRDKAAGLDLAVAELVRNALREQDLI